MRSGQDVLDRPRAAAEPGDVVVVCGLPGVGKSTVSWAIAAVVDGVVLRTDIVRRGLVDDPVYTAGEKRRVYDELFDRAHGHVEAGQSVVLDGTYRRLE